jgi:hypothetical protein
MSATNDRAPALRIDELLAASDALAVALQRLMQDPTPGRAEAIARHTYAMHRAAGILAVALGELIAGEVA